MPITAIPAGGLGGAVLVYITKSKGKRVAFIPWVVSFFAVPATLGFLFCCPDVNIAGIHTVIGNYSLLLFKRYIYLLYSRVYVVL